jgi:hypothetical protein
MTRANWIVSANALRIRTTYLSEAPGRGGACAEPAKADDRNRFERPMNCFSEVDEGKVRFASENSA